MSGKNESRGNRKRGTILAMSGGILWGFSGTCGQFLFSQTDISVQAVSCIRMFIAGIILLAIAFIRQKDKVTGIWRNGRTVVRLLLFSICGLMLCQYTYLMAISYSNAGTATVLQYLAPVIIMVIMCVYRRRLPFPREVIALVLALTGVFLLATRGDLGTLALSKEALIWGLAAAAGLTLYSVIPGSLVAEWGSMTVTGYGLLIAGIATSLVTRVWNESFTFDFKVMIGLAGLIIPGTVLAYTMYLQGVSDVGADLASLLSCTEPVAATVFAAALLGTEFLPIDIAGFAAIIIAVILLTTGKKTAQKMK